MSQITLLKDSSALNQEQIAFITNVTEKIGFTDAQVSIETLGQAGDNFIAAVKRIKVMKDGKVVNIVAKVATPIPQARAALGVEDMFHNETVIYLEVLPKFSELETSVNMPEHEKLRYAECYGCLTKKPLEIILLEDLTDAGYTMLDKLKSLNDNQMKSVLENFAKYHSFSYILKHKEPETFAEFKNKLKDNWTAMRTSKMFKTICEALQADMMTLFDGEERYQKALEDSVGNLPNFMEKSSEEDWDSEFAVICHADAWTNNFMFSNKTNECCIIDFQLARLNVPAADLHFIILNSSDYETRSKHYNSWINYYHDKLAKNLAYFGLKINSVYPMNELDKDLKRYAKMFLGITIWMSSIVVRDVDSAAEMKKVLDRGNDYEGIKEACKVTTMKQKYIVQYKSKIKGIIDSHIESGYL